MKTKQNKTKQQEERRNIPKKQAMKQVSQWISLIQQSSRQTLIMVSFTLADHFFPYFLFVFLSCLVQF